MFINKPEFLKQKGPLLIASNHPNSFLDAMILDILFVEPVWSLARGDVFVGRRVNNLLHAFKTMPVYRTSEGVENLSANYQTFEACRDIFRNDGLVSIFSEGKCVNEWHLRPLKKGTARLAIQSWEENIPLRVLPVGINYSSFFRFGKNMFIHFGELITKENIDWDDSEGNRINTFNDILRIQLEPLVLGIGKDDKKKQAQLLEQKASLIEKILLFIPAIIGWLIHAPLYLPLKLFVIKKFKHTDHYDSVLTTLLIFSYPVYLLMVSIVLFFLIKSWLVFCLLIIFPFTAWSYIQLKQQLDN